MSTRFVQTRCPECGQVNDVSIDSPWGTTQPVIVYCDTEDGGCDAYYAAHIKMHPTVATFQLEEHK